jgi:hypothetical protein
MKTNVINLPKNKTPTRKSAGSVLLFFPKRNDMLNNRIKNDVDYFPTRRAG